MCQFTYDAHDEADTQILGRALAESLSGGATLALHGTLGAGKTRLVQAIAEAAGVQRRQVVSPTFVLVQQYHGRCSIYHIDAYRLRDEDEFEELGPDEFFASDGLVLIEWAERVAQSLPRQRVDIQIEVTGPQSRRFTISAVGSRHAKAVQQCRQACQTAPRL